MNRIFNHSCESMPELADDSVDVCVTSPPYWGLRDYGTGEWVGGDADCDHRPHLMRAGREESRPMMAGSVASNADQLRRGANVPCGKCGATRVDKQIGLELTPGEYIDRLVTVFREVRRVLRPDGTLWVNIGDSYAAKWSCNRGKSHKMGVGAPHISERMNRLSGDLKEKDLIGIPWLLAFALRADGWYLRSDIIWHKPNPMPSSVEDRCTTSHEYIFMLAKSRQYYFDADAIREDCVKTGTPGHLQGGSSERAGTREGLRGASWDSAAGRNKRDVWTVSVQGYAEAHFATFPPDLIRPCIMAGSRSGGLVLDPFMGAGTTARVAIEHGRHFVGYELNPDYCKLIQDRLGLFGDVA